MRRALGLAAAIAVLVAFVAFAFTMNPDPVDFRLTSGTTFRMPLGLLLIATLVTGVLVAVVAVAIQQLNRRISTWSERRREQQQAQIEELNESGAALAWNGETERSRGVLKKAWRRDTHNTAAALALAESYEDTGELDGARQVLEEAVERESFDPDLRFALGQVLRKQGNVDEAIRILESVRVQYPHAARVMVALRQLYADSGRWREAVNIQRQFVSELASSEGIHGERDRLRDYRYQAALQIEDATKRAEELGALLDEDRDYIPAIESLGEAWIAEGRADEAQRMWERAFKRAPSIDLANRMLAAQTSSEGRQRVLSAVNRHAAQLDADAVHVLRARVAIADDALETAQNELEAVGDADAPAVRRTWADLHQKRGDGERAWQTLRPLLG